MTNATLGTLALTFLSHRAEHPDAAAALADLQALLAQRDNYYGQIERQADRAERAEQECETLRRQWAADLESERNELYAKLDAARSEARTSPDVARLREAGGQMREQLALVASDAHEHAAIEDWDDALAATADNRSAQGGK